MSSENSGQYEGQKLGLFIFDCFMSVMYLALSVILLFTVLLNRQISGGIRTGLGVLFGLYGIFRVSRAVKRIFQKS